MKKVLVSFSIALVLFLNFLITSCTKDELTLNQDASSSGLSSESLPSDDRACTVGLALATFNGVTSYQNCPIGSANTYGDSYVGSTYVGKKWQCVEYVQRYYRVVYGLSIKPAFGNANTFWTNNNHATVGLQKFSNGATAPQIGDILVSTGGSYGHVAIVSGVTSSSVTIIDQNFSSNSQRTLSRSGNVIGGFNNTYPVAGLVRRIQTPAQTPSLLTPSQNAINLLAPVNFTWSCPNGSEYRIQIIDAAQFQGFSTTNGFSGSMAYNNNIGNITSFAWTQAPRGRTFYWTVRANNSGGTSSFAQYRTFKTKP